jgi:tRNA(Arg) A34 adenosine deaminase TadA
MPSFDKLAFTQIEVVSGVLAESSSQLLSDFFASKR